MSRRVDYIIIGLGLAGSALAWELMRRGKSLLVFDNPSANRASAVAAGLFNPITGRVLTKTWMAEAIFPFLDSFYGDAEKTTGERFFHKLPIYRPFVSAEERMQWQAKIDSAGIKDIVLNVCQPGSFNMVNPYGGIEIVNSGYLNVMRWIETVRKALVFKDSFSENTFQEEGVQAGEFIRYEDVVADKIIFCNGMQALKSPFFHWLPLRPLKGQTLDVRLSFVPERIFNRGVYVAPSDTQNVFKVGATYEHAPFSESTTDSARNYLSSTLDQLIGKPFEILHQDWGIRPTTPDRRPILGAHPENKNVVAFNGLGTKGVSLSPYFAHHLATWLEGNGDLSTEVNINRFKALYSS
jgi:glycine oxidase